MTQIVQIVTKKSWISSNHNGLRRPINLDIGFLNLCGSNVFLYLQDTRIELSVVTETYICVCLCVCVYNSVYMYVYISVTLL